MTSVNGANTDANAQAAAVLVHRVHSRHVSGFPAATCGTVTVTPTVSATALQSSSSTQRDELCSSVIMLQLRFEADILASISNPLLACIIHAACCRLPELPLMLPGLPLPLAVQPVLPARAVLLQQLLARHLPAAGGSARTRRVQMARCASSA
jgi:hypothetical protein